MVVDPFDPRGVKAQSLQSTSTAKNGTTTTLFTNEKSNTTTTTSTPNNSNDSININRTIQEVDENESCFEV